MGMVVSRKRVAIIGSTNSSAASPRDEMARFTDRRWRTALEDGRRISIETVNMIALGGMGEHCAKTHQVDSRRLIL